MYGFAPIEIRLEVPATCAYPPNLPPLDILTLEVVIETELSIPLLLKSLFNGSHTCKAISKQK